jgi:GNAT superfamily N-acetyltransferase
VKAPLEVARAMALNCAAWTEASVRAFGIPAFQTRSVWWRGPGGSPIYLAALVFDPEAPDEQVFADLAETRRAWGALPPSVDDCFATRDLGALGYERRFQTPWYLRPPGPIEPPKPPAGLSIEVVSTSQQLADFEEATTSGFEVPEAERPARFAQHAEATLSDAAMVYLNARLEGRVVASTITHVAHGLLGIYGISSLPAFRRRGYGTLLVHAAVALRPDLPACVHPEPVSVPMYTCHGFTPGGEIAGWRPRRRTEP